MAILCATVLMAMYAQVIEANRIATEAWEAVPSPCRDVPVVGRDKALGVLLVQR